MERKKPSSSKSSKSLSSKQNAEETSRTTRSKTRKVFRKNYNEEDSSADEMANVDWSQIANDRLYFRSSNELKEKIEDDFSDVSSMDIDVCGISVSDTDSTDSDRRLLKEISSPATLPSSPDRQESGSSSPFRFWGKNAFSSAEPIRCSGSDVARKEDETEDVDNANVGNASKDINKDIRSTDWEKWRVRAELKNNIAIMKELRRSKKADAENAGKPLDKGSYENLGSATFSPRIAEDKGITKRQSYPGNNALKENRPRMST